MAPLRRFPLFLLAGCSRPAAGILLHRAVPVPPPESERQKRVVVQAGNGTDPYEKARHWDDWIDMVGKNFDHGAPLCATEVRSHGQHCTLLSQVLCNAKSTRLPRADQRLGRCFKARKSCAVVGSSAHLLNASWGELIDSHDLVIRINGAPAGSTDRQSEHFALASHVGTRTDVRFVNRLGELREELPKRPLCLFRHEPELPKDCGQFCWAHPATCTNSSADTGNGRLKRKRCDLGGLRCGGGDAQDSGHNWDGHEVFLDNLHAGIADQVIPRSTAGFKAVIYAMSICERVTVIGFGPTCSGSIGERYYASRVPISTRHHYAEELALLLRADKRGSKAIIPPEARKWIATKKVTVALPKCVDEEAAIQLDQVFAGFGNSVKLVSERGLRDS